MATSTSPSIALPNPGERVRGGWASRLPYPVRNVVDRWRTLLSNPAYPVIVSLSGVAPELRAGMSVRAALP